MHYVGPDQLHGFETRTTTDIYPADFGWTPDYRKPGERIDWWYHNLGSVTGAGVAEISNQMEYDDEVAHFSDHMKARWDLETFDADVRESQARRHIVYAALRQGHYYPWDYQPLQLASERYMRNHMDLNILEETKRFPRGE